MADDGGNLFGTPTPRIDGPLKVTGAALYASDEPVANPAYACLVTSSIARGRIVRLRLEAARAVPGVQDILTHDNVGSQAEPPPQMNGGKTTTTLESDRVWHGGQIIALVIADTFEAASEAAAKVEADYAAEPPSASFDSPGVTVEPAMEQGKPKKGPQVGDADAAFAGAPVRIEARYSTPTQHHNPIELFTTTCVWDGPRLTIYEGSQSMYGLKNNVAEQLGIDPSLVRTVSRFVGGAFGSRGGTTSRTAWVAIAARRLNRPVKLVATRAQGFTIATYRAETRQHVKLAAGRDGKLVAFRHEGWEVTSRPSGYNVSGTETTARMYACPNIATQVSVVHADRNTPGFMRAPPDTPYMFALESAMDELAYALEMDPIELRRINDTKTDPVDGKPYSSRSLMKCFDQAAERFGWTRRATRPGSMREGDWQVGYGCATSCYPSNIGPAALRLTLMPKGEALVQIAAHEIGTGAYTTIGLTVAHALGLDLAKVDVRLGDSNLPPAPVAGGSNNAASTVNVAVKACREMQTRLTAAAVADPKSALHGLDASTIAFQSGTLVGEGDRREPLDTALKRVAAAHLEIYAENLPQGLPPSAMAGLYQGHAAMLRGESRKDVTAYAFGAHLVEVRVHALTREVRVARVVSAFASGTIVNPMTAYSQYMGGAIWGLSSALFEATEIDPRAARYVNKNLADYLIPVNADIPDLQVILVPETDERVNPLGIKGIGEIGIVGMNAAVCNAIYHATGVRLRDLPVRAEKLLPA
jgi:xanthine dehydrogenase YagR molybdenum-binding subunit